MKHVKQRVVAIDYFRGIFILVVVINHAAAFSIPFTYLTGASGLWTSAAEMFMLLSGITLGIVRADSIKLNFWQTAKKIWRRAAFIYLLNIVTILLSLTLALFLVSHNYQNGVTGELPTKSGLGLLFSIVNLSYSIGWASFLGYFAVFLTFAPPLLYALRSRYWYLVPAVSLSIFLLNSSQLSVPGNTGLYAVWQIYFVLGLTIGSFWQPILAWCAGLKRRSASMISKAVLTTVAAVMGLSILLEFNLLPAANSLTANGWLPHKLDHAYSRLMSHKPTLDLLLMDTRTGVLRPLVAILFLASIYLLYLKYKDFLLRRTGRFVNSLGRDTLWIFVAQAFAIPLLGALAIPRSLLSNFMLTSLLVYLMWLVTKRRRIAAAVSRYSAKPQNNFLKAKYTASYRQQNN